MQNKDAPEECKAFKYFSAWHSNVKILMDHVSGGMFGGLGGIDKGL
jgi:hypothetical protein